jgi:uncharacterized membrane protein YdjX (TVP38/TMEM64 family)
MSWPTAVKLAIGVALVAGIVVALTQIDGLSPALIEREIRALGWWAPAGFVALAFVTVVLLGSVSLSSLVGGALFGVGPGFALTWLGTLAGALAAFALGRFLIGAWVARQAGGRLSYVLDGVAREGWRFVTLIRLIPVFQFASVCYLFGATKVKFWHYAIPTALCMIPGVAAFAWLGHAGRSAAAGSEDMVRNGLIALGLLAVAAAIPRLVGWLRRRRGVVDPPFPK